MITIPEQVYKIIKTFESHNYKAYVVGGCVRDSILGKTPDDWDITTNALPEQTIECFKHYKIVKTGLKHGTVTIIVNHKPFEVTTFRIDGKYSDNRRPDTVEFTRNIKEDLSRRDFTINAIAYNPSIGLVDYFNGEQDIKNKIINCVGNPDLRFNEDALRIMRALRFSSVLGFKINDETLASIHKNKSLLNNIAVERISNELNKLLIGDNVKFVLQNFTDIILQIIPEIKPMIGFNQNNQYHHLDVWQHTIESVAQSPNQLIYRLTMLLHDIGKPSCYTEDDHKNGHFYAHPAYSADIAVDILKRLKYDNLTINCVKDLIFYHDYELKPSKKIIKRLLNKLGQQRAKQLIEIKRADIKAHNPKYIDKLKAIDKIDIMIDEIVSQQQCFRLKDLAINGNDLINLGIPKGTQIGTVLNKLMNMVIDDEIINDKQILLNTAIKLIHN